MDRHNDDCVCRQLETISLSYPSGNSHKAFLGLTEASENQGNFVSNIEQKKDSPLAPCVTNTLPICTFKSVTIISGL